MNPTILVFLNQVPTLDPFNERNPKDADFRVLENGPYGRTRRKHALRCKVFTRFLSSPFKGIYKGLQGLL